MQITNPTTLEKIKDVTEDTKESILKKMASSREAHLNWIDIGLEERLKKVKKFSDLLDQKKDQLATTLSLEVGKPLQESYNEINGARKRILFFLENSSKWLNHQVQNVDGNTTDSLSFDPLGIICNISAWNYPYLVGVNVFVPALIAGNNVFYKPSEFSTLTGLHIAELWKESGVSEDVFTHIIGGKEVGEILLDCPFDGYFFTGSFKTGQYIANKVASKMVPVGLELGGKDPLYVTEEIKDVLQVASAVVEGCFYNNGQSCCAVERVYVHEKIYDQFIECFLNETKKLKMGDPLDQANLQGSIARPPHINFLDVQVQDAIKKGAKLLLGGTIPKKKGSFFPPTVLTDVNHTMSVMKDETFGPVRGLMKVKNDDEAIKLMNDTDYGLTASVYSHNIERAKKILQEVNAGTSYINCCDRVSPYLPWAGRKHSGMGATLSFLGILAFAKPRGWQIRN
jgi:acyl-CoA reductase-like NAD-dependent aldehyde dehydrogenase